MGDPRLASDKLLTLFDKVVAGGLQEAERQELEQFLKESHSSRSAFRDYVAMHAELASVLRLARSRQAIYREIRKRAVESQVADSQLTANSDPPSPVGALEVRDATPANTSSASAASLRQIWRWSIGVAATVAAIVCISLVYLSEKDRNGPIDGDVLTTLSASKPPAPVATLASQNAAVWQGSQLVTGTVFREGDAIRLESGEAQISVGFGAEIAAAAPCTLQFLSADRVRLDEGKVAVQVAEWAKGFTVVTDKMDVVDLGTTFTVSAAPGKLTEAAVLKGVVRVHSSKAADDQPRGLLVTEGQQISIDERGLFFDNVAMQDADQRLRELDFGVGAPYRPVTMNNTGLGLSIGDEDLHWQVVAGPEGTFAGPQFASVCPPERGYLPNYPDTSQWISIADWKTAAPNAVYTFRTKFDLEGYDLATIQLFGRFLADNGIVAVRVNGQPVHVNSWVDNERYQPFGDLQFRFVNVTEGLVSGQNVIEIDVRNGMIRNDKVKNPPMKAIPNPMALRVEWYAFGRKVELAMAGSDRRVSPGPATRTGI